MIDFNQLYIEFISENSTEVLIRAGIILVVLFILLKFTTFLIAKLLFKISRSESNEWKNVLASFINGISWVFYLFISIYLSLQTLSLPVGVQTFLNYALMIISGYYIAKGLSKVVDFFIQKNIEKSKKEEQPKNISLMKFMSTIIKIIIWALILLVILSNLGVEITALVAGLGVGGIAIALALQNVLGDLFSAIAIYFDKPFEEGDFIIIGTDKGVIKRIGIKTTRIQTLEGQELVVSNSELTKTRINNYKKMEKRRIVFNFGVVYSTSTKKLKKINKIVENIIKKIKKVELDRVHFREFGDSSLKYEVVYYIDTSDYKEYMDIQQKINFELKKQFKKEKIEFAYPTQTIFLEK